MCQALTEFLTGIQLQHPGWLWAWPLSLLAVGLLSRRRRLAALAQLPEWPGRQRYRHPQLGILRRLQQERTTAQTHRAAWRPWLHYGLMLLCLHLALAQPYRLGRQLPTPPQYRDTLFLIDTSLSLVLRDYLVEGERTQRMTILKSVLSHFIDQLDGNRIGLIVFSEQPYTLAPLTADYALLKSQVRRLEPAVLTGRTTDLSRALLYSLQQLQRMETADPQQKPALVLVTDVSRSYRDLDPRAIAAHLRDGGYRLHTIGIGASSYEAQEYDSKGLIYEPTNFTLLEEIAERGGGGFYWADNVSSLQAAIQAIQLAERRQVQAEPRHLTLPLYQWPLLAGLIWLLTLQLRAGRRRRR